MLNQHAAELVSSASQQAIQQLGIKPEHTWKKSQVRKAIALGVHKGITTVDQLLDLARNSLPAPKRKEHQTHVS